MLYAAKQPFTPSKAGIYRPWNAAHTPNRRDIDSRFRGNRGNEVVDGYYAIAVNPFLLDLT